MNEEKRAEYEEKTRQRWESRGEQEWGWSEVAEVLVKTVCGLGNKGVASPWTVGREREIEERIEWITERVRRRNERVGMLMRGGDCELGGVRVWNSWRMR